MIEEVMPDVYKLDIPLPGSPLKALNSYVMRSADRHLIVDVGWNNKECGDAMQSGLKELGIELQKADFFITHLHADHIGLLPALVTETSTVYFNEPDSMAIGVASRWQQVLGYARSNGFPEDELQPALHSHPGFKHGLGEYRPAFSIVKEGDTMSVGDYRFTCVATPGHTRGHMCLYEPSKKALIAGDHVLIDITPNIALYAEGINPLKEYLASLDKVAAMDIELVLPGHRRIFTDCKKRINELQDHHQERANEVLAILGTGNKDAYQVAAQMSWDIVCDSWELFPFGQKWFATGEAMAHLKYLEEEAKIHREMRGNITVYCLN